MNNGGECSIFMIHKEIRKAFHATDPKLCEQLTRSLKPDFFAGQD